MTTTQYLTRPGGRLAYDVSGSGPLVVASPGLGALRSTYRFLVPALVEAGYRVATVDLRGHGESSVGGWGSYTETDVADDLIALVEHLGGPAVIIGNSYSGGAAVVAAARRPELVRALVLTGAFVHDIPRNTVQKLAVWLISSTPLGRAAWGSYVPSLYGGRKPADHAAALAALTASLKGKDRFTATAAMAAQPHIAAGRALPAVTAPALVVMGEQDPDFADPAAEAAFISGALVGPAQALMVAEAGHYPHTQRPDLVNPAVVAFLAGLAA